MKDIAQQLSVREIPVRETLRRLEPMGLTEFGRAIFSLNPMTVHTSDWEHDELIMAIWGRDLDKTEMINQKYRLRVGNEIEKGGKKIQRIIDLSVCHENGASEPFPPQIKHSDHAEGAVRLAKLAGIEASDFPDSLALATDYISGSAHSGTHVDAPWHYGPICEGRPSRTIDQIPLEWCYGPGVILDMRHKEPGSEITVDDLKEALEKIKYTLKPLDIVMLQTGADKYWGTEKYLEMQSGLGVRGTSWLLEQGIRCIGIDAWGLDRPAKKMAESYKQTGDKSELWPTHMYGRKREYLQIEKLANLDKLSKPFGFMVAAFPVKFCGGSAGWTRAVAIIEEP